MRNSKKAKLPKSHSVPPEEALRFLEDLRTMSGGIDEPTVAISLRVPGNILRALRAKARAEGKKYQSLMVEFLRSGLRKN